MKTWKPKPTASLTVESKSDTFGTDTLEDHMVDDFETSSDSFVVVRFLIKVYLPLLTAILGS